MTLEKLIEAANSCGSTVYIQKMSITTAYCDCTKPAKEAREKYGCMPWRVQIGKKTGWHYHGTLEGALKKALLKALENCLSMPRL